MKNAILSALAIACMLVIMATPVYAASSSFYFEMGSLGRVVDGSDNGVYHSLSAGGVMISGTVYVDYKRAGALTPKTIYIQLFNKTSGNKFGTVSVTPYSTLGKLKTFSGTFSSVGGGTSYYLYIYRAAEDGNKIIGSGTLKNI